MRWEPFMFILLLTTVSCLVILIATRNAKQRGLRLLGLALLIRTERDFIHPTVR